MSEIMPRTHQFRRLLQHVEANENCGYTMGGRNEEGFWLVLRNVENTEAGHKRLRALLDETGVAYELDVLEPHRHLANTKVVVSVPPRRPRHPKQ